MIGSSLRRRFCSIAGIGLLAALMLVVLASPASAHSVLLATSPAASGQVSTAPASVVLTFNEMPRGQYSNIHVVGPDGARRDSGHVKVLNDTVSENLGGSRPAGTYVVDWRVISADGHPVSGQFSFTSTTAAAPLAARLADTTGSGGTSKSSGSGTTVIVVVIVVVVAAAALAFIFLRRSRRPSVSTAGRDDDPDGD
jgi:methionine-rich copper-binding protein CopC